MKFLEDNWFLLLVIGALYYFFFMRKNNIVQVPVSTAPVSSASPVSQSVPVVTTPSVAVVVPITQPSEPSISPEVLAAQIAAQTPEATANLANLASQVVVQPTAQGQFTALDVQTIITRAYAVNYSASNDSKWIVTQSVLDSLTPKVITALNAGNSPTAIMSMIENGSI